MMGDDRASGADLQALQLGRKRAQLCALRSRQLGQQLSAKLCFQVCHLRNREDPVKGTIFPDSMSRPFQQQATICHNQGCIAV